MAAWVADFQLGQGVSPPLMPGHLAYVAAEVNKLAGRLAAHCDIQEWLAKPQGAPPAGEPSAAAAPSSQAPAGPCEPAAPKPSANGVCPFLQSRKGQA